METIQVVMDETLLAEADRAARRTRQNRSALIRDALRDHLSRLELREREERDRQGYQRTPNKGESAGWQSEAVWPE